MAHPAVIGELVSLAIARAHLPARLDLARPLSDEELFDLCREHDDLRIERTKEGTLLIMSPTGGKTGNLNFMLTARFGAWVEHDGSGLGFDSSTGFVLPNGAQRSPDVAWVRRERWESLSDDDRKRFPPLCPDFVIELRSPSDDLALLREKMQEYIASGVVLGWLIDPPSRRVFVYRPAQPVTELEEPSALSGDPELPGLSLSLDGLW